MTLSLTAPTARHVRTPYSTASLSLYPPPSLSLSLLFSCLSLPPCTISPSLPPDTPVPVRYDGSASEGDTRDTSVPAESSAHASRGKGSEEWLGVGQRFERSRKSSGSSPYDSAQVSFVLVCLCVGVCAGRVCEGVYWYARVCRVSVINRPLVLPLVLPLVSTTVLPLDDR